MLSTLRRSQTLNPEALSFSGDLQRTAARRLVWGILGTALAVWLVLGTSDMQLLSGKYFALGAAMALYLFLALRLAGRPSLIAQVLFHPRGQGQGLPCARNPRGRPAFAAGYAQEPD